MLVLGQELAMLEDSTSISRLRYRNRATLNAPVLRSASSRMNSNTSGEMMENGIACRLLDCYGNGDQMANSVGTSFANTDRWDFKYN